MANAKLQEGASALVQARNIVTEAGGADKLTAEQRQTVDKHLADWRSQKDAVKLEQDLKKEEKAESELRAAAVTSKVTDPSHISNSRDAKSWQNAEYANQFDAFMRTGKDQDDKVEYRAMQADKDTVGGFTVTPVVIMDQFLQNVDDELPFGKLVTTIRMPKAAKIQIPQMGDDASDPDWTSELGEVQAGSDLTFKARTLEPHALTKLYKLSRKLITMSNMDIVAFVMARLARKFGLAIENGSMTGNGSGRMQGAFVANDEGIGTARDVSAGNTTTSPKFEGILAAKYALKSQYRKNAKFLFHPDSMLKLALLKDGEDRFILQPSVIADTPDKLSGYQVLESQFAPNTFTASQYFGLFGDFAYYWMAMSQDLQIQVLQEMYALTNQNGYVARADIDGCPVLAEAFVRLQLAAS